MRQNDFSESSRHHARRIREVLGREVLVTEGFEAVVREPEAGLGLEVLNVRADAGLLVLQLRSSPG